MIHQVFAVRDSKTEAFLPPFYSQTEAAAIRSFRASWMTSGHPFHDFPEDYSLFHLGTFDDATGKFDVQAPAHLISAFQFIVKEKGDA